MAHYAWINSNNTVINVTVGVDENVTHDNNGTPVGGSTEGWETFYTQAVNQEGVYLKRTSYNAAINGYRKQFAGLEMTYNADDDVFVQPQPYPSWALDSNHDWQPPTPKPDSMYFWNEAELAWVAI